MLLEEKKKLQESLETYIYEMSKSFLETDEDKMAMADNLLVLYKGTGFRHNYSRFFPIILNISKEDNFYDINTLSENLEILRTYVESVHVSKNPKYNSLYLHLEKLCDHMNLEIARWSYYSQNENKIEDLSVKTVSLTKGFQEAREELKDSNRMIDTARENLNVARKELSDVKDDLNKASETAKTMQVDVIAVLSIFAGIVFAFSGGFTYLGSVMTSIREVQHYEAVVLMAIICGIVVFNTLFLLLYLVGKITKRDIYAKCETEDCSCEKKCYGVKKIRKRLPYVYWFNLFAIIGIIIDCAVWYCDIRDWFYL